MSKTQCTIEMIVPKDITILEKRFGEVMAEIDYPKKTPEEWKLIIEEIERREKLGLI